ncbi:MAG TPA: IclR family transcriptional regulator C-terminal domain-containing protein [Solirubrobacteraceae bacterium]|jgi:IclR family pca regulon transcriptional regulator
MKPYEDTWLMPDFSGPRYSQSLARGLAIMECFEAERSVLGIAEIAKELGMSRSTTHRYLATLVALGYMEQDKSRKYRLSLRVTDLGMAALHSTGLQEHARSILEELRQGSGFTTSLAMLDGPEIVYVDRLVSYRRGQEDADVAMGVGSRLPAYCTALGKVLLAQLPAGDRQELLRGAPALERQGPNAITGKGVLRAELEMVLEEGFATEDEELAAGRIAIAASVCDATGTPIAAIDLAADTSVISLQRLVSALHPHLIAAADRISARLGYRRDDGPGPGR